MSAAMQNAWVGWMNSRQLPEIESLEKAVFSEPWSADRWRLECVTGYSVVSMIDNRVIGAMVYESFPTHYRLNRILVHPGFRRMKVATSLVQRLLRSLDFYRSAIFADVPDDALESHLFFRDCGFKAIKIFDVDESQVYRFRLSLEKAGE